MAEHPLAPLFRLDPDLQNYLKLSDAFVYSDGALPRKLKLVIAMAFDAAHGADQGVAALAGAAIKAGATKQEIVEAVRVAVHLSGIGAAYTASKGLAGLESKT
jgi:alkylhydroperoxidase/carboxymuconolactone decarboxylase family protein YurZ